MSGCIWIEPLCIGLSANRPNVGLRKSFEFTRKEGLLYSCNCTRKSLPCGPYPGYCRHQIGQTLIADRAVRIDTSEIDLTVDDLIATSSISQPPGDFIVKRRDGLFAYQLACAVDERIDGITHVIRGIDLLDSTIMQRFHHEMPWVRESNIWTFSRFSRC